MEPQPTSPAPAADLAATDEVQIDDVNSTLHNYIFHQKLWQVILIGAGTVLYEAALILLLFNFSNSSSNNHGGNALALPIALISSWYWHLKKKFEDTFLREFAARNHFSYVATGTVDEAYGTLFRLNGKPTISDIVTGTYHGATMRLFLHDLTVQEGRSSTTYRNTVIELDLQASVPDILLLSKKTANNPPGLEASFGTDTKIQLEGDFSDRFTLLTPEGNQIPALEVFTPDTMQLIEQMATGFNIEFAGNRIYIYATNYICTNAALTEAFTLARQLIDKVAPVAQRMQGGGSFAVASTNDPTTLSENRSKYGNSFGIIAWIFAGAMVVIVIVAILLSNPQY